MTRDLLNPNQHRALAIDERVSDLQHFQREMVEMRSQLAVMKYRAFHFMQAVQLLEMKLNACEGQKNLLRQPMNVFSKNRRVDNLE